ncbi:RNA-binding cell elongation regulator Jag/EloR [Desulfovibrio cuneatus]|uniref:RNA-binding cell elongation regulator Jag/EloR n=1 Tax=Desulfovibrio cuneatus TaxID=159728 RepID=UPI0004810646|nr:RNA-binding cell elongation regulator Jag/EloR [Desulfovibrio cuneatus]
MTNFKEFQGKNLDEAISEACSYYGVGRDKLEIDIVNDAKTGIFGLVGAKKATVRACRVNTPALMESLEETAAPATPARDAGGRKPAAPQRPIKGPAPSSRGEHPRQQPHEPAPAPAEPERYTPPVAAAPDQPAAQPQAQGQGRPYAQSKERPGRGPRGQNGQPEQRHAPRPRRQEPADFTPRVQGSARPEGFEEGERESNFVVLEGEMAQKACTVACNVVLQLVQPIVGEVPCEAEVQDERLRLMLDCGESVGILVGREGQTLASIQYLASRLVAKQLGGAVRLQIDVGNYRERQDERLREMALFLGDKAKKTRRVQVTRPLSAYQRRIIHLALEGDTDLQTHSKGEGPHRRVVIQARRGAKPDATAQADEGFDEADEQFDVEGEE